MAAKILTSLRHLHFSDYLLIFLSGLLYFLIGYRIERDSFALLILILAALFLSFLLLFRSARKRPEKLAGMLAAAVLFRLLFIASEPRLSDDYKRYLWDGSLTVQGINPYLLKPSELPPDISEELGDWRTLPLQKDYYSVYPPIPQAFFAAASLMPWRSGRLLMLHLFALLTELGAIFLMLRIFRQLRLPLPRSLLYIMNPLPIIELSGNLHIEVFMIFFVLLAAYFFYNKSFAAAGISLSASILSKFIPLIFLPAFLSRPLLKKNNFLLLSATSLPLLLLFILSGFTGTLNMLSSLSLYFNTFEFNGSIYSLIRWAGYQIKGYNVIHEISFYLGLSVALYLALLSLRHLIRPFQNVFVFFCLALGGYFLLATTVNPWYITPLLAFGVFTRFLTPLLWSMLVFLSYEAFHRANFQLSAVTLIIEYGILTLAIIYDLINKPHEFIPGQTDPAASPH
jgi:hypothetical protein